MNYAQVVFSPTGGTMRVAQAITKGWNKEVTTVDLTDTAQDFSQYVFQPDDLLLIAIPSYGGRVPALAADRIAKIHGNDARCVLVCVYGNRAYEDTLVEMQDIAQSCGLRPIAAIAAVAEHSILHQYATGRPDADDLPVLQSYSSKILQKFQSGNHSALSLPGNRPYKKAGGGGMVPHATSACVNCGLCAKQCPAQAISREDVRKTDGKACISCMRCVVQCPHSARKINGAMTAAAAMALKKACSVRKECELFL